MGGSIFFQVVILDNQDPLMLGRVRATLIIDNYQDIVKGIEDWNEERDKWTVRDPFVFNPLMPYFMYQVPKVGEMAQIIYSNSDFKYQNQYYIQNTFSTPTSTNFEYYVGGNKFTGTGTQYTNPKPLKNQDGTYSNNVTYKGIFPEPGDNAILGRGSADLIVKQDEVLLRAGKFKDSVLQANQPPVANEQRSFLQLSRFNLTKKKEETITITQSEEIIVSIKYLIEWTIINPENTKNKFSGQVYLYQLKPDLSTNSKNLTVGSDIQENLKKIVTVQSFELLSKSEVIVYINDFIKACNSSTTLKNGTQLFSSELNKFPIFYRPNNLTYNVLYGPSEPPTPTYNPNYVSVGEKFCLLGSCSISIRVIDVTTTRIVATGTADGDEILLNELYQSVVSQVRNSLISQGIENVLLPTIDELDETTITAPPTNNNVSGLAITNVSDIFSQVKLYPALKEGGYGLIYAKNKVGKPLSFKSTEVTKESYSSYGQLTYGALGGDKLFLLSQTSAIPGKQKINFSDTLYGISEQKFVDDIIPNTSSLVRGEELLELVNLIVRFLITHTHAFPGLPPVPVTQDGSTTSSILAEMQNAATKILNKNIRLN
jgi:hypothetical protein